MDDLTKMKKLIELQNMYKSNYINSDTAIEGYEQLMIEKNIYPSWWRNNEDVDFKIELITQAINEKKELNELEIVKKINQTYYERAFNNNFEESKKKHL